MKIIPSIEDLPVLNRLLSIVHCVIGTFLTKKGAAWRLPRLHEVISELSVQMSIAETWMSQIQFNADVPNSNADGKRWNKAS